MHLVTFVRKSKRLLFSLLGIPLKFFTLFESKNANIWVFGNRQGFRDNSRYLFQYVLDNVSTVKPIWIANNIEEKEFVESIGGTAIVRTSLMAVKIMLTAGVGIICIGLRDLAQPISKGMLIVNLFHGNTLKKLGLDTDAELILIPGFKLINKFNRFLLKRTLDRNNLVVASSKLNQQRFSTSFGLPKERIPICGQPRVDILKSGCKNGYTKKKCPSLPQCFILYAPTWRESGGNPILDLDLDRWNEILSKFNVHLLLKLHPLTKIDSRKSNYSHVSLISDAEIEFTHLLYHTQILISDYSGAIVDYALLERPILLFAPDLEEYSRSRGLYEPLANFGEEIIFKEEAQLLNAVREAIENPDFFKPYSKKIAERYNDYFDGKNCERTVQSIASRMS